MGKIFSLQVFFMIWYWKVKKVRFTVKWYINTKKN